MPLTFTYQPPAVNGALAMHEAKAAAETAGAFVLLKAALPLVPFDEGDLYASGQVEHQGEKGAAVFFSAVNPEDNYDYAGIQHQDTELEHHHGQAHYLSDPMRTDADEILAAMAGVLRGLG